MNAEQLQTAAELCAIGSPLRIKETISTIAVYYYSARKLILILPSHWVDLDVCSSYPDGLPDRKQSPILVITGPTVIIINYRVVQKSDTPF